MQKRRQVWLIAIFAIVCATFACGWSLLHPHRHDPYPFLSDHDLVAVGVIGPGGWGPKEVRVYSWKQPWQLVAAQARHDLPHFGLSEQRRKKREGAGATWMGGEIYRSGLEGTSADLTVNVIPGRFGELRYKGKLSDEDPRWVTVLVVANIPDTWVNIVRYTCFPIGD